MPQVAQESKTLQDELLSEIELSVIPYKLDNKVRVEILNEAFIKYLNLRPGQHAVSEYLDEDGMGNVPYSSLRDFYTQLKDAFKEFQKRGIV